MLLILIGIAFVAFIYLCLVKPLKYWERNNVPQNSVGKIWWEFLLGFIPAKGIGEQMQEAYNDFSGKRYGGSYLLYTPSLILRDPELIQQLTVKDFDVFTNHFTVFSDTNEDIWEKSLAVLKDEKWRNMRATLSPSFTSSKLKIIYPLMTECVSQMISYLEEETSSGATAIEMKDLFSKITNDIIASSAFGISCNSFRNPKNDFFLTGKALTNTQDFMTNMRIMIMFILPKLAKALGIKLSNPKYVKFFTSIIEENIKSRETRGIVRPDMIQLMLDIKNKTNTAKEANEEDSEGLNVHSLKPTKQGTHLEEFKITNSDIESQAFIFFFAGFDTSSTMMSFMAYELALNPDVQDKLYREILDNEEESGNQSTIDKIQRVKYLDMVVSETLRKYPVAPGLERVCKRHYLIPPVRDDEKEVYLEEGHVIYIPVIALHKDPQYFPDPERFDPERFSEENKVNIVSGTYMPFGIGPRYCIGNRFALMEIKTLFYNLLIKFKLVVVNKTEIPLIMSKNQISLAHENGNWIGVEKRY